MKRKTPHLMAQSKGVSRKGAGPQGFHIQPGATHVEKVDTEGMEKDSNVHRDGQRYARRQRCQWSQEGEQNRGLWADARTCRTAMAMMQTDVSDLGTEFSASGRELLILGRATRPWAGL